MSITAGLAIGSAIAGVVGSLMSSNTAKSNNAAQINWANTLSTTTHQREVEDLKKAGINPIMTTGTTEASPSLNLQQPDYSGIQNVGQNIAQMLLANSQSKQAEADTKLKEAQKENTEADTDLKTATTHFTTEQTKKVNEEINQIRAQVSNTKQLTATGKAEMYKILEEIKGIQTDTDLKRITADLARKQQELTDQETQLTIAKRRQTAATGKSIELDNQIKEVKVKMKYIDYGLEKLGQLSDIASDWIPGVKHVKALKSNKKDNKK